MPRCLARRVARRSAAMLFASAVAVPVAVPFATAHAQTAFTLNFNNTVTSVPDGINYVQNCYVASGIRVVATGESCNNAFSLATYTSADPTGYTGSGALFAATAPSLDLMPVSGTFSVSSIQLAPGLLGMFDTNPVTVLFTGTTMLGGTLSFQTVLGTMLTGLTSPIMLSNFTNLTNLRITPSGIDPYVQIDNVVGTVTATPEPATFALLGLGLGGVGLIARRRRAVR